MSDEPQVGKPKLYAMFVDEHEMAALQNLFGPNGPDIMVNIKALSIWNGLVKTVECPIDVTDMDLQQFTEDEDATEADNG
jgi:hypothetical protein